MKEAPVDAPTGPRPGRNEPCHCGSGRKYKQCHLDKDEDALRVARAKASDQAAAPEGEAAATPAPAAPAPAAAAKHATHQPWKKGGSTNTRGFQRMSAPRKVGSG